MWYVNRDRMIKENFKELKKAYKKRCANSYKYDFKTYLNRLKGVDENSYASYVVGTSLKFFENYSMPYMDENNLIKSIIHTVIHEELHDVLYRIDGYTASVGLDNIDAWGKISAFNLDEI